MEIIPKEFHPDEWPRDLKDTRNPEDIIDYLSCYNKCIHDQTKDFENCESCKSIITIMVELLERLRKK